MLILLHVLCIVFADIDSDHIRDVTYKEMEEELENPDYLLIQILYREQDKERNELLGDHIHRALSATPHYYRAISHECSHNKTLCPDPVYMGASPWGDGEEEKEWDESQQTTYPKVTLHITDGLSPNTGKALLHRSTMNGIERTEKLGEMFQNEMPYLGKRLSMKDYEAWMAEAVNKVVFVSPDHKVPSFWKGLASKYKERLLFGYVHFEDELKISKKRFGVKKAPGIVVITQDGEKIYYDSMDYDFEAVDEFLEKHAHKEKTRLHFKAPVDVYDKQYKFSEINTQDIPYEQKQEKFHKASRKLQDRLEDDKKKAEARKEAKKDL